MPKKRKVAMVLIVCIILFMRIGNTIAYGKNNIKENIVYKKDHIEEPLVLEVDFWKLQELKEGPLFLSNQSILETANWTEVERLIYEKLQNRENNIEIIYTGGIFFDPWDRLSEYINKVFQHDHYIYYNLKYCAYGLEHDIGNIRIFIKAEYRTTKEQEEFVDKRVREILSKIIKSGMSDRAKVKAIHDYIVFNVEYDTSLSRYTAYNALKEGKAVCQGYALLGYKMLNEAGIPTRILCSVGMNHVWNLVQLDGKWYHLDITWDDPDIEGRVEYYNFLITDEAMMMSHFWEPEEYPTSGEGMVFDDKPSVLGWFKYEDKWYYIKSDGTVATGWLELDGKKYYFGKNGVMQTGWLELGGKKYYFDVKGIMQTGWLKIDGKQYYFDNNGVMKTGWVEIGNQRYYLDKNGVMQTGWQKVDGKWYYMDSSGSMQTGWQKVGGNWYYLNSSGMMQTGWQKINGKWYYLKSSGAMATGWVLSGGKWYYLSSSGAMQTGWQKINGKWYYLIHREQWYWLAKD